ncbi:MAG: DEAD/DEAH box helicase, partial [Bacteroidia bacterium]
MGKNLASWNIEETFEKLNKYFETVRTKQNGFSLNELFLFDSKLDYEYKDEWVPDLGDWLSQKELIKEIDQLLKKMNADTVWQKNIFSNLEARSFALNQDPSKLYSNSLNQANAAAYGIQSLTNKLEVELYIGDLLQIRSWAKSIKWLIEKNLTQLVLDDNGFKKDYQKLRDQYFAKKALIEKRSIKTNNTGLQEVSIRELESALSKCEVTPNENELKRFVGKFISNDEWFIDDVKNILKNAIYERKNELQLTELTAKFQSYYKTNDPENFIEQVSLLQDLTNRMQYHLQGFFGFLNKKRFPDALMQMFLQYNSELQQLEECGFVLHQNFRQFTIDEFQIYLNELKTIDFSLELEQLLKLFNGLKPNLKFCFEHAKIPILELEKAAVQRELQRAYLANPELETFNSQKLNQLSDKLNSEYNEWLKWNSWKLLDAQVLEFQRLLQLSETPATKLGDLEKQEKWSFKKGIRIIRNEIDKTRQHKSLRELVHSDAKNALDVLKPIYLMSPVAVAETFPCKKELFDVVVFDEASQLRVEEVLPIVHRAKRVVVVGDSEQLPPTDFFKSTSLQAETADNLKFSSFLMAAKAAFKSQQLSWHYRSLSQELIQFSNAAFYQNNLKVFPSCNAPKPALKSIRVEGV